MGLGEASRRAGADLWLGGISVKNFCLMTLTIQNSALILILYYSRTMPLASTGSSQRYFTSTAVALNEVLKLGVCLTVALYEISQTVSPSTPATSLFTTLASSVFTGDSWKLAIPASLYTLQNTLQYIAISHLDAATLQVTYQLKVFPTALFSILLLRRSLSGRKWIALGLLMLGVAIVQIPAASSTSLNPLKEAHSRLYFPRSAEGFRHLGRVASRSIYKRSATYEGIEEDLKLEHPNANTALGLTAAVAACTVSALASVYFEKILKESHYPTSVWIRNVQLSFYSLFPAFFIGVVFVDGEAIARSGFFVGYNWVVWTTIACQALGGILVALCVHYANNIAKSFATSISVLISLGVSVWLFDFTLTTHFLIGVVLVMYSTYLYNTHEHSRRPPPIRIHDFEKTTIDPESARQRDFTLKGPMTPLKAEALSTSRPSSPLLHHSRVGSSRGYFAAKHHD
ncbi:hypothetical protein MMC13_000846 [Lambiella insularis]|nr:hypothetical protein [Lambiella insularis]